MRYLKKIAVLFCMALMLSVAFNSCKDKNGTEDSSTESTSQGGATVSEQEADNYLPTFEEFVSVDSDPSVAKMSALMRLAKWPETVKKGTIEEIVTVAVLIDKKGEPVKIQILQSANSNLNESAITAVMKYDGYTAAKKDGKPVACWLVIPIKFQLKK